MGRIDTRGRVTVEPKWPSGGIMSRPMAERNWSIQQYTGYPVANNPKGGWVRGQIVRGDTVTLRPSGRNLYMYDPTDPASWNNGQRG